MPQAKVIAATAVLLLHLLLIREEFKFHLKPRNTRKFIVPILTFTKISKIINFYPKFQLYCQLNFFGET